jgi:stage II sporulation protein GA (sporulation sigma-E factor processing peptidase)
MFDFLLLLTVKIILKREVKWHRVILGSIIGALSIFFLFIPLNSITLFLLKVAISILMIISTFGFKNYKYFFKNILYLYFVSIILGGFLYYLNLEFSYKNIGLLFFHNGFSINFILLIIISPIILYLYIKQDRELKKIKNYYYNVELFYKNKRYKYQAYLDTGNKLYDPYSHKPIILLYDPKFILKDNIIYIPYQTLEHSGLLKCFKADKIVLDNELIIKKPIVAISTKQFKIDNIEMLLHSDYLD